MLDSQSGMLWVGSFKIMATRFREKGVFNRSIGKEFREQILAQGDSRPPMELYKAFMGREPGLDPLLERQGLTGSP